MINPLKNIQAGQIMAVRRSGNTIRLVDHIIQLLYHNPSQPILILDHHESGSSEQANKLLRDKLHNRIDSEHNRKEFLFKKESSLTWTVTYNPK